MHSDICSFAFHMFFTVRLSIVSSTYFERRLRTPSTKSSNLLHGTKLLLRASMWTSNKYIFLKRESDEVSQFPCRIAATRKPRWKSGTPWSNGEVDWIRKVKALAGISSGSMRLVAVKSARQKALASGENKYVSESRFI